MICSLVSRRLILLALGVVLVMPGLAKADEAWDSLHMTALKSAGMVLTANTSGSAFVVDIKEKLVVTHYQVVRGQEQISVLFPWYQDGKLITDMKFYLDKGAPTKATVIATNRRLGLAILQVEKMPESLVPVSLATEEAAISDILFTVGFDFTKSQPFAMTVHQVTKAASPGKFLQGLGMISGRTISVDTPFTAGNGGAPVFNDAGELVGIAIGGIAPESEGIVIHAADAKKALVEQLQEMVRPAKATPAPAVEETTAAEEPATEEEAPGIQAGINTGLQNEASTEESTESTNEEVGQPEEVGSVPPVDSE